MLCCHSPAFQHCLECSCKTLYYVKEEMTQFTQSFSLPPPQVVYFVLRAIDTIHSSRRSTPQRPHTCLTLHLYPSHPKSRSITAQHASRQAVGHLGRHRITCHLSTSLHYKGATSPNNTSRPQAPKPYKVTSHHKKRCPSAIRRPSPTPTCLGDVILKGVTGNEGRRFQQSAYGMGEAGGDVWGCGYLGADPW